MDQTIKRVNSSDGTQIAYTTSGSGPPIVKTATYITHLEHDWENAVWHPFLTNLSRYNTLIRYDERGCGLSDWYTKDYSFESWVEDLKAVVDAENLDQFYLFGQSQGSTVATAFAARYPERVKKLIILGGYARGWLHRDLNETEKKEEQLLIDMMRMGWGKENPAFRQFFCAQIMPGASAETMQSFSELMKISTEPEIAAQLERQMHLSNVVKEAPLVKCPTLILHPVNDASIPFKEGKILADLIPNSRFVRLNSINHILQNTEPAWSVFWKEFYQFIEVTEDFSNVIETKLTTVDRLLRTIVFTDIVESTKMALELGDKTWLEALEIHNDKTRNLVALYNGEVIKNTGDGFLITFELPSNALEFGKELINSFEPTPIDIRCGVHSGEIEKVDEDIHGINIHIASRVLGSAGINELWLTSVVKALTQGSSFNFKFQGEYNLKGIPNAIELYKVN